MKNIFSSISFKSLKDNILNIAYRFTTSFLLIYIISILFFVLLNWDFSSYIENNIIRAIFSWIITFFLSIWVYLASENFLLKNTKKQLLQIPVIIFGILFFVWFNSDFDNIENLVFFILSLSGIISFIFFAPYIKNIKERTLKQDVYFSYFYKLSTVFLVSFILWWLLVLLWNIAIIATFELFDISYNDFKTIWNWMIIALAIITPLYALINIPQKEEYNNYDINENIFFSFLIKYIAIPFIYVYFIILYTYSIKVLSSFWEWPKWEVAWLVIVFSSFGYLIYIFSYLFENKNKAIKIFRKYFPYVVIPQVFMLAYAIYLRINQYDLTINRYFVVVFWLWLLIISLYFIFSKKKYLSFITTILTIFTVIISIWPWWVYSLPESRQYDRLINNLEKADILNQGEIIALESKYDIDKELSKNIYSWVNYLCNFDNCNKIKQLFDEQYNNLVEETKKENEERKNRAIEELENKYPDNEVKQKEELEKIQERFEYSEPRKYQIVNHIKEEVKLISQYDYEPDEFQTITYSSEWWIFPININWYSKIYEISSYNKWNNNEEWVYADMNNKKIEIHSDLETSTIDISNIIEQIYNYEYEWRHNQISKEKLIFELDWYKLIIQNITLKNKDLNQEEVDENYYLNQSLSWYLLIK